MPKISVIVPIYNVEKYLNECVDSILNQTYSNLEIILVNDGSTDNCSNICEEYRVKDNRVKVIHKTNGGLSDARNIGLDISSGEYISFVDSDDAIHPKFIETLYSGILKFNADVSFCNVTFGNFKEEFEEWKKMDFKYFYLDFKNQIIKTIICNKLFKKELWNNLRFEKGKLHEDMFVFPFLFYGREFAFVDQSLYFYRQRTGSITKSKKEENWLDILEAFNKRTIFFNNLGEEDYILYNKKEILYANIQYYYDYKRKETKKFLLKNINSILNADFLNTKEKLALLYFLLFKN